MNTLEKFAFISPQGTMFLKDDLYLKKQGSSAENGGQIIYVIEMARALAAKGHQVDIYARNYESKNLEIEIDENYPGMHVIHIPTTAPNYVEKEHFYPYYPEYLGQLLEFVEANNLHYSSIVGHYADGMTIAAGLERFYAQEKKAPVPLMGVTHSLGVEKAHSLHETLAKTNVGVALVAKFKEAASHFNIRPRLGCELSAIEHADGMACVSNAHTAYLHNDYNYPEDQMAIIPGGINGAVFKKIPGLKRADMIASVADNTHINRKSLEFMQDGKIIFGFGRLVHAKGIVNAVKSMETLLKSHPDAVYVYAGGNIPAKTGEEKEVYDAAMAYAKERGYEDRIVFLGRQDQNTIAKWLNVSNVYLHCAALEPFGLAPQEAAATGIPCVISMNAGVAEVLHNNYEALHTDPQSPVDIAKQVGRILSNPPLGQRMAQQALEYIEHQATWGARADQMIGFIEKELRPNYFARREQRAHNGNMYLVDAQRLIDRNDLTQLPINVEGWAITARNIIDDMLKIGLPESHSANIALDFGVK